jgi:hypothetical protein
MMAKIIITNGSQTQTIFQRTYDKKRAVKGLNPFTDETPGVWSPDVIDTEKQARSSRLVPSVFAGIGTRMQAMMDMPFTIYGKGGAVVDDSDDYHNVLGFLPNPARQFGLSEAALVTTGRAYWYKSTGTRTGGLKELRYWLPASVTLDAQSAKQGEIKFRRQGVNELFDADSVLYHWLYDESVEVGPPLVYPLASAMIAAEANGAITTWVRDYMQRGAIKAMLLAVDGAPPAGEIERMESWWNRFMTGGRGLLWKVFNMSNVKPTIVGDGLEALKDLSINKELRYEIHTALGTRHLLEDENFATAGARERQFYTQAVVPDARLIGQNFNDQILAKLGYHLEFEPERLEIFQENEGEQAKVFGELFGVFREVMSTDAAFELASEKLDYSFTDEQKALIKKGIADKQAKANDVITQMQPKEQPIPPSKALIELDRWEQKVNKAGKMMLWHAVELAPELVKAISQGEMTFQQARAGMVEQPADDTIKMLACKLDKLIEVTRE